MINLPKDFVLIISGVSCVGKTTAAYNLLKEYPEFKRVTELDIIRMILRSTIKDVVNNISCSEQKELQKKYEHLFSSSTSEDFFMLKEQSKTLVKYIKEIVKRQQERKIPTIIEGVSIVPSVFFKTVSPLKGLKETYCLSTFSCQMRMNIFCEEKKDVPKENMQIQKHPYIEELNV